MNTTTVQLGDSDRATLGDEKLGGEAGRRGWGRVGGVEEKDESSEGDFCLR